MQETWVWPLGQEDALEKEMATHSSILAWRIPQREEPSGLQNPGAQSSSVQLLKPAHYNRESPCTTTKSQHCLKKKKKKERKKELYGWGFNSGFIFKRLFIPNLIVTICATTCALTIFQGAPLHLHTPRARREAWNKLLTPSEGANPAHTFISHF